MQMTALYGMALRREKQAGRYGLSKEGSKNHKTTLCAATDTQNPELTLTATQSLHCE
jgi:hypothetical protein